VINTLTANLLLQRPNNQIDGSIVSRDQLRIIMSILEATLKLKTQGDIVEFGCYVGESSKYLRMMLDHYLSDKKLYVYDSFEGLPQLSPHEENTGWRAGTLKTSEDILLSNFYNNGLKPPIVTKGWFNKLDNHQIPNEISFAFLDGDFYTSIYDSLSLIWSNIVSGGVVLLHDYERNDLPGVKQAVIDFLKNINSEYYLNHKIFNEIGIIYKII
jgi:O-methyltransferase